MPILIRRYSWYVEIFYNYEYFEIFWSHIESSNESLEELYKFKLINKKCHERLSKRRKWKIIGTKDKLFLIKLMVAYPDCHNFIKKAYKLPESTLYLLREATKNDMKGYSSQAFKHDNEEILNKVIHQKLIKIIEPPQFQMNSYIIHQKLWEEILWEISRKRLRHIMKHQLRYSYIKGDPRPLKVASSKHIMTKGLF